MARKITCPGPAAPSKDFQPHRQSGAVIRMLRKKIAPSGDAMGVERASSTVRVSPTSTVAVLTTVELSAALTYNLLCAADSSGSLVTQSEAQRKLLAAFTGMSSTSPITELLIASSLASGARRSRHSAIVGERETVIPSLPASIGAGYARENACQRLRDRAISMAEDLGLLSSPGPPPTLEKYQVLEELELMTNLSSDFWHPPPAHVRVKLNLALDSTRLALLEDPNISAADKQNMHDNASRLRWEDALGAGKFGQVLAYSDEYLAHHHNWRAGEVCKLVARYLQSTPVVLRPQDASILAPEVLTVILRSLELIKAGASQATVVHLLRMCQLILDIEARCDALWNWISPSTVAFDGILRRWVGPARQYLLLNRHLVPKESSPLFASFMTWVENNSIHSFPSKNGWMAGLCGKQNISGAEVHMLAIQSCRSISLGSVGLLVEITRRAIHGEETQLESVEAGLAMLNIFQQSQVLGSFCYGSLVQHAAALKDDIAALREQYRPSSTFATEERVKLALAGIDSSLQVTAQELVDQALSDIDSSTDGSKEFPGSDAEEVVARALETLEE